jgi:hypothetical protein
MHGHENIVALRKSGISPKIVFLNDYPCRTDWFEHGDHATVCTAGDIVQMLDLRFLVGLTVSISSISEIRAKALFEKCKLAKAATVAACHSKPNEPISSLSGWVAVWRKSEETQTT